MTKILLIEADADRAAPLIQALEECDLSVSVAPSGVYALTMIERDRPDLILARTELEDMKTSELAAIIRSDSSLRGVRVVAIAPGGSVSEGQYEAVLKDTLAPEVVAAKVCKLATWTVVSHEFGSRPPAQARSDHKADTLCGSLDVLNLMELTQAFYHARKTGRLVLECSEGEAAVYFSEGQVIHASFDDLEGRAAFARALVSTEREKDTAFCFQPLAEAALEAVPRTIVMTAPQLLLAIVVDLDEAQLDHGDGAQYRAVR